ncbi:E3 ubiquitin-protein ligase TRIM39-like [Clinocottus analis]|uniref:E3 ubiquitin-protein ligase TRIM39-like n=1 Tax=Clinocottus analis TaxID=304258 RepID=UPI0035C18243
MAAASSPFSEDHFLCSICLDVFTAPVTVPCGHNFCKACITEHWDMNPRSQCPMCNELFETRPVLHVNTFISEMAAEFRHSVQKVASSSSSEGQESKPGEVLCEICTKSKVTALKSCLVCLASYCETHLEPHHRVAGLQGHTLIDPVENLQSRLCENHYKPLELFCRTDQTCVCRFCTDSSHRLPRSNGPWSSATREQAKRRRRVCWSSRLRRSLLSKVWLSSLRRLTRSTKRRRIRRKALSKSWRRTSLSSWRDTRSWSSSRTQKTTSTCSKASQPSAPLRPPRTGQRSECTRPITGRLGGPRLIELRSAQQFAVDVTLDPETAHQDLILSDDGKRVSRGHKQRTLPDNPKRFSTRCVLAKQSFSSGRFYHEVQVRGKTDCTVGVVRESVSRKDVFITMAPVNGYWIVRLMNGNQYKACTAPAIQLILKSRPQKVGVFVDYEEGLVSFYDVDAPALIYSFTGCAFTEKLYPYLNPKRRNEGKNTSPLIICSVDRAD